MSDTTLSAAFHKPASLQELLDSIHQASPLTAIARIEVISANKDGYGPDQVLLTLEDALTREVRTHPQRRSVIQELKRAIKKHKASKPQSSAEVIVPSWDRARQILQGIKLHIRLSVAGQCILGFELATLKKELGFINGRNQHSRVRQNGEASRTWSEWVKEELELSDRTADRFIEMFEGAKARHKKLGGAEKLIGIFETPASELSAIDRQTLEAAVSKLTDGITQKELLEELKLVKIYDSSGIGGDTSSHAKKDKPNLGQLAFAFFEPLAKDLQKICVHPDRDKFFTVLAKEEPSKLNEMELSLESALHAIRAAKASHTTGKVIS